VLRDVASGRKLIAAFEEARAFYDAHTSAPAGELHGLLTALKIYAERYADHPGFGLSFSIGAS
jgi:hypothetical protein